MCSLILSLLPTACVRCPVMFCIIRFFSPATSVSYPLSLHDALPICPPVPPGGGRGGRSRPPGHRPPPAGSGWRSEEHTSELQSRGHLVCRLLLEKKKSVKRQNILDRANQQAQTGAHTRAATLRTRSA